MIDATIVRANQQSAETKQSGAELEDIDRSIDGLSHCHLVKA